MHIHGTSTTHGYRKFHVAASLLLLLFLLPAAGADVAGAKPKAGTAEKPYDIAWGPFLQNLTSASVTVLWSGGGAGEELVEYGETKEQLSRSVRSAEARATIAGLKPGKSYFYRVTSKPQGEGRAASSAIATFTTPVEDVQAFSFVILADTHQSKCAPDLAKRILAEKPDFVLHLGDRNPSIVGGLLKPYKEVMQQVPMYMARGNHDTADKQRQFSAMPGPGDQQYYSYRWGNARFICVNTEDWKGAGLKKGGPQYQWLENELKTCKEQWKFVFQHIPVYSAWDGGMNPAADDERALLEQYKVDVVFQGHMHNYDRSLPLRNQAVAKEDGVIYITASGGCGGNEPFPKGEKHWFIDKTWRGEPFIGSCAVNGDKARIQFMTPARQVFDSLELQAK